MKFIKSSYELVNNLVEKLQLRRAVVQRASFNLKNVVYYSDASMPAYLAKLMMQPENPQPTQEQAEVVSEAPAETPAPHRSLVPEVNVEVFNRDREISQNEEAAFMDGFRQAARADIEEFYRRAA